MKKLFLIPLMTLVTCVMAWGEDYVAQFMEGETLRSFSSLKTAIDAAPTGATIELTADINYGEVLAANSLNITKSITIDGKNHTLKGASQRPNGGSNYATIWINQGGTQVVNVTIKNLTVINERTTGAYNNKGIETRGNIGKVTLDNVSITSKTSAFQVGGNQSTKATFEVNNCYLHTTVYYPICSFNPYDMTITNSVVEGWCAFYFKPAYQSNGDYNSCAGSRGSSVVATNCTFNTTNIYSSVTNGFGTFVLEDDNISITLNNCATNSIMLGNQDQSVLVLSGWAQNDHRSLPVSLTINGDNSYINGNLLSNDWAAGWDLSSSSWVMNPELIANPFPLSIEFTGGTYAFNPAEAGWLKNETLPAEELYDPSNIQMVTIPDGYEVKEITTQQGEISTTLWRVRKEITNTSYVINDDAEGEGKGKNENTEFIITGNGNNQSVGTATTDSVIANYIEVSDKAILTVSDEKVLVVTNGMDVTEGAKVIAEVGSTIKVGEGGVTSESVESIVIEADENGSASFLLDPEVIINTTPALTVRMTAKQIGRNADGDYYWHRFAMPVAGITSWDKEGNLGEGNEKYPTYVYAWDYDNNDWKNIAPNEMEPLQGYTLTLASEYIDGAAADGHLNVLQDVTYIFKGNLVGNQDQDLTFQHEGFNYFGNSYTGYMDVKTVLNGLGNDKIDGTAYMWCNDPSNDAYQTYVGVSIYKLNTGRGLEDWMKEVAPMQTFILRLRGADEANESVSYSNSIWGNPRYGNNNGAGAPARAGVHNGAANEVEEAYMEIVVTAANGSKDRVDLTELTGKSDAFESGYDIEKYMNERHINFYATVGGMNMSSVVTDNLVGKTLSLQTLNDVNYTLSFANVEGEEYALLDKATNNIITIDNASTYNFSAQPNSTIASRFEIVGRNMVVTGVDNVENNTNAKGIYTMLGQYVGEDFNALPSGVYIMNGVKVVK